MINIDNRKYLGGTSLAGMSLTRSRAENDFYATPFDATRAILDQEHFNGSILEPAAGEGHISKIVRDYYPDNKIVSTDLVQREDRFGCNIVGGVDFLTTLYPEKFNNVITNPPFSLAKEFVEKALQRLNNATPDSTATIAPAQNLELEQLGYINGYNGDANRIYNGSTIARALKAEAGGGGCKDWMVQSTGGVGNTIRYC